MNFQTLADVHFPNDYLNPQNKKKTCNGMEKSRGWAYTQCKGWPTLGLGDP